MRFEEWFDQGPFGMGFGAFGTKQGRKGRRSRKFRWRVFERGDLKFAVLQVLSEQPRHGYEVMKALEERSNGMYKASPGSVYPILQMLEDEGYLTSDDSSGKKVYSVTDEGLNYLEDNREVVDDLFDRVSDFTDRFFGESMRDLSKAFRGLANVTWDGCMRWDLDDDLMDEMVEILEGAAESMRDLREQARERKRGARSEEGEARAAGREEARRKARKAAEKARKKAQKAHAEARETARQAVHEAHKTARQATAKARATAREARREAREAMRNVHEIIVDAVTHVVDEITDVDLDVHIEVDDVAAEADSAPTDSGDSVNDESDAGETDGRKDESGEK